MRGAGSTTVPRRTREDRDRLVEKFLPLVHHLVGRLSVSLPVGIERDDLFGAGVLGLMHAAATYDSEKGATFKTYAYTIVRGAILDELRRQDPVPRSARERIRRLEHAWRGLASENGRSPTHEELCERLGCTPAELDESLSAVHTAHVLSLEDASDENDSMSDRLVEPRTDQPFVAAHTKESLEIVTRAIGELPDQARQAIVLYYHEGLLLKEIGTILGVSESRVSQILSKALARLRLALKVDSWT